MKLVYSTLCTLYEDIISMEKLYSYGVTPKTWRLVPMPMESILYSLAMQCRKKSLLRNNYKVHFYK